MLVNAKETKKMESFIDVFKGTCELNGYEQVKVDGEIDFKEIKENSSQGKVYYIIEDMCCDEFKLRAANTNTDKYDIEEMFNMIVKTLYNAGMEGVKLVFDEEHKEFFEDFLEDLDALEIPYAFEKLTDTLEDAFTFDIRVNDETVGDGSIFKDEEIDFLLDYPLISVIYEYREDSYLYENTAVVVPKSKEVMSDAFIIATNLKDLGYKTAIDYSLGQKPLASSQYIVELDETLLKKYMVKLIDRDTHEEKEISIDDLAVSLI